jgi:hypothetical protein
MRWLRKCFQLQPLDFQLLIIALLVLNATRLGLYLLPFQAVYQQIMKVASLLAQINAKAVKQIEIARLRWAIEAVSRRLPYPPKCLARALTMQVLLRWQGYPNQIQIGVAKNQSGQLEAHAWVESNGKVVIGQVSNLSQYTLLPAFEERILQ